jgi:hypothetical protein
MPTPAELWSGLLTASLPPLPAIASPKLIGSIPKLVGPTRKQKNEELWLALDRRDVEGVLVALETGASPTATRMGIAPLWEAAKSGSWAAAKHLIAAGAKPTDMKREAVYKTFRRCATLWSALAATDNADGALEIIALGAFPEHAGPDLIAHRSNRLLLWWHEQFPVLFDKYMKDASSNEAGSILTAGLEAGLTVQRAISKVWGLNPDNPVALATSSPSPRFADPLRLARHLWSKVFTNDDPAQARNCLAAGWALMARPGIVTAEQKAADGNWNLPFLWLAATQGSWRIFAWAKASQALRDQAQLAASQDPSVWWLGCINAGVPVLEAIRVSGLVDMRQQDAYGNTVLHKIMGGFHTSKAMIDWWFKHDPGALSMANNNGETPLTLKKTGLSAPSVDKLCAYAAQRLLRRNVTKASRKPHAMGRSRL